MFYGWSEPGFPVACQPACNLTLPMDFYKAELPSMAAMSDCRYIAASQQIVNLTSRP
jgi:hypothetical protein